MRWNDAEFYNVDVMDETLTTIPAYFDGEHIRLRVPYVLQPNAPLLVTVLAQPESDSERQAKLQRLFALKGIFKNDPEFDAAMEYLDTAWKQ